MITLTIISLSVCALIFIGVVVALVSVIREGRQMPD
jgi:hypothetical protein